MWGALAALDAPPVRQCRCRGASTNTRPRRHSTGCGDGLLFTNLPTSDFPDPRTIGNLDALEEIAFAGFPNGIYDRANNLPIVRRGTTATPAYLDYEGNPVFLIDASVFPGSSGSPVFIYSTSPWVDRSGDTNIGGRRFMFLGVLSSVFYRQEDGRLEFAEIPATLVPVVKTREMIDLGVVFKARTILETLEHGLRATATWMPKSPNERHAAHRDHRRSERITAKVRSPRSLQSFHLFPQVGQNCGSPSPRMSLSSTSPPSVRAGISTPTRNPVGSPSFSLSHLCRSSTTTTGISYLITASSSCFPFRFVASLTSSV